MCRIFLFRSSGAELKLLRGQPVCNLSTNILILTAFEAVFLSVCLPSLCSLPYTHTLTEIHSFLYLSPQIEILSREIDLSRDLSRSISIDAEIQLDVNTAIDMQLYPWIYNLGVRQRCLGVDTAAAEFYSPGKCTLVGKQPVQLNLGWLALHPHCFRPLQRVKRVWT